MAQYNSHGSLRKVLLCPPTYYEELTISEIAHRSVDEGDVVNRELAIEMHEGMVQALREAGVEVLFEEPHPDHKWQVYTRDFGAMTPVGALIGKFKYRERWGDEEPAMDALNRLGYPIVGRVTRGAVEGGDCWLLDECTLVIGSGNRSTIRGIEEAGEILKPHGVEVVPVEFLAKWNHLDMIFSVVADKLALVCSEALPGSFLKMLADRGWRTIDVPVEHVLKTGCNVLALGDGRVLTFEENTWVNERLRAEGFRLYDPPLREFTKMGGGPHCLTFELERDR